ncbi:MAG: Eco57I restriction-modification methylase domain-containing protein [Candidatus Binataceae bacterium]
MLNLKAESQESITEFADRVGRAYLAGSNEEHRRRLAQYFSPTPVAAYMAQMCTVAGTSVRVLDPGAGTGILACALLEHLVRRLPRPSEVYLEAYEIDENLAELLEGVLRVARQRLSVEGITLDFGVRAADFTRSQQHALSENAELFTDSSQEHFDVAISNPPYFKLARTDPRARAAEAVIHGQPNIYAVFMATAASILSLGGELIFLTPRSFASGLYFRRFREWFFRRMRPEIVHVFESRREAFERHGILQENVILKARRIQNWTEQPASHHLKVASSRGVSDLSAARSYSVGLTSVLNFADPHRILRLPVSRVRRTLDRLLKIASATLKSHGLGVSTGPVVPFRAVEFLSHSGDISTTHVPLLWMHHVHPMATVWPIANFSKEQFIRATQRSSALLVDNATYVLIRRFSAKEERRRLVAAPLLAGALGVGRIGLENHLNYVHRPGGSLTADEAWGLAALLNTMLFDEYFREQSGNTQVSATELAALPLPPLDLISRIGRTVRSRRRALAGTDEAVIEVLGLGS